ncbi:unnamed protein product, partial [Adineta steineri]
SDNGASGGNISAFPTLETTDIDIVKQWCNIFPSSKLHSYNI